MQTISKEVHEKATKLRTQQQQKASKEKLKWTTHKNETTTWTTLKWTSEVERRRVDRKRSDENGKMSKENTTSKKRHSTE